MASASGIRRMSGLGAGPRPPRSSRKISIAAALSSAANRFRSGHALTHGEGSPTAAVAGGSGGIGSISSGFARTKLGSYA